MELILAEDPNVPDDADPCSPGNRLPAELGYETSLGKAFVGDSLDWLRALPAESVDLVLTSPPFALNRPKRYGNVSSNDYLEWFVPFTVEIHRVLRPTGSFVLELGSAWTPLSPTKSLYQFQVLIELVNRPENAFHLAQDFYWYNPARLPSPAEWVTVRRIRVKDAVSPVWWLSKTPWPNADNRRVLKAYSVAQRSLFDHGYNSGERPSEHTISANGFSTNHGGAIPPNVLPIENMLSVSNTASNDRFLRKCRELEFRLHPARFPLEIPEFFIRFLTEPGATVVDPFAGSNSVGWMAESLDRRWLSCEIDASYAYVSRLRFGGDVPWLPAVTPDVPRRRSGGGRGVPVSVDEATLLD